MKRAVQQHIIGYCVVRHLELRSPAPSPFLSTLRHVYACVLVGADVLAGDTTK